MSEEEKKEEKYQRQVQIISPGVQVILLSECDEIEYLIGEATKLIDKYKGEG